METSETTELPIVPKAESVGAPEPEFTHCDDCHAPVDHAQRYCVNCGAHRRHVHDPATRYLSQSSARLRSLRSAGGARRAQPRTGGVGIALALALIPVAALIGAEVGRSSNNQDAKLYRVLEHPPTVTVLASSAATPGSSAAPGTAKSSSKAQTKTGKRHAHRAVSSTAGKAVSKTQYGSANQVTGAKVSAAQEAQGTADAQKIQNSTGKSYVQAANSLPSTVVP